MIMHTIDHVHYMFIVYMIYTYLRHSVERAARRGAPVCVGVGGAEQRLG